MKAELFKLRKTKAFWVLIITMTLFGLGFSVLLYLASKNIIYLSLEDNFLIGPPDSDETFSTSGIEILQMSLIKNPILLTLLAGILAGFFISNDYVTGVMKNVLITGKGRNQVYIAKLITFSVGVIIIVLIYPIISTTSATIFYGFGEINEPSAVLYIGRVLGLYLLQLIAFSSILMFIAILSEENGKTIAISFSLIFVVYFSFIFLSNSFSSIQKTYEHTVLYQLYEVYKVNITSTEVIKSAIIALMTCMVLSFVGNALFLRKDIS